MRAIVSVHSPGRRNILTLVLLHRIPIVSSLGACSSGFSRTPPRTIGIAKSNSPSPRRSSSSKARQTVGFPHNPQSPSTCGHRVLRFGSRGTSSMVSLSATDLLGLFTCQLCLFASALQEVCLSIFWHAFHHEPPGPCSNLPRLCMMIFLIPLILNDLVLLLHRGADLDDTWRRLLRSHAGCWPRFMEMYCGGNAFSSHMSRSRRSRTSWRVRLIEFPSSSLFHKHAYSVLSVLSFDLLGFAAWKAIKSLKLKSLSSTGLFTPLHLFLDEFLLHSTASKNKISILAPRLRSAEDQESYQ